MINTLTGKITHKDLGHVVLNVGGVGYKVKTKLVETFDVNAEIMLWTYLAVREDALELYGFSEHEDLQFFELLLKVSGIGPKSALAILSQSTIPTLKQAITTGDIGYLTKVSGIGRKTGEKIIIELRDRVGGGAGTGDLAGVSDALEALVALGYGRREAQDTLRKLDHSNLSIEEIVKKALGLLSGNGK